MTPHSWGQGRRYPQHPQRIDSLTFYVMSLDRLSTVQKCVLLLIADCAERGPPFQPSLAELARLCSCSRKTVWLALRGLDGQAGWIKQDWRGGQKTNRYFPGWRLQRLLRRR